MSRRNVSADMVDGRRLLIRFAVLMAPIEESEGIGGRCH